MILNIVIILFSLSAFTRSFYYNNLLRLNGDQLKFDWVDFNKFIWEHKNIPLLFWIIPTFSKYYDQEKNRLKKMTNLFTIICYFLIFLFVITLAW